jgi:dTDP-4-amino-4,6-dideoxygalactose transaminase
MIPFNRPPYTGNEDAHVLRAMRSDKMSGDGDFGKRCQQWFQTRLRCAGALLTPSCTQALEMAALLLDIGPGDEVIMPSYTFVSTANAFAMRGATIVFVDIRADTMNIDENLIKAAITPRTRAIVVVHYAGVACEMDPILAIAGRHGLAVIEDAAQGMMSSYKGRPLGALGDMGAYSFHETKNFTSGGEGGLFIARDPQHVLRAEVIREKGTNRSQFFRGMVDKYSWVDLGSSYLPSEIQAAYLWGQLESTDTIMASRLRAWHHYRDALTPLRDAGRIELPVVPGNCEHNAHMYYVKARDLDERTRLIAHLASRGVMAVFHYVPLHSAPAGRKFGRFHGADVNTTRESERLVRLPLWYGMNADILEQVVDAVLEFYR